MATGAPRRDVKSDFAVTGAGAAERVLDSFQAASFGYFCEHVNPENGLVADTSRKGSPCSIAVVGFALTCYPIGVERGWMSRAGAAEVTRKTLQFFAGSAQGEHPDATGYRGFYYHFLGMEDGKRKWNCEVSPIDSSLLLAGMLAARSYFDRDTEDEAAIRELSDSLYRRTDWNWAQNETFTVAQGWKPESGFLHYGWEGYSEAIILYALGMGSPTHPLPAASYAKWTSTYQWENLYGQDHLYAGPLFIHQFSQAWIDFRGIRDRFMREKGSDYFRNSRQAVLVQREYAVRNPRECVGYGENFWGLTACDGPGPGAHGIRGAHRRTDGYVARAVPYGPDDGTLCPAAMFGALPFAPEIALAAIRNLCHEYPEIAENYRVPNAVNPSLDHWVSDARFGLDQGLIVLMIENYRSGFVWELMKKCEYVAAGLREAGFAGGWLRAKGSAEHGR